jgi:hypothetical protein
MSAAALATLLAADGIDTTDISKIIGNHANIVVEILNPPEIVTSPLPDSAGKDPSLLLVTGQAGSIGDTIDTSAFSGLKNVVLPDDSNGVGYSGNYSVGGTHLTFQGDVGVHLYLGDLAGAEADGNYYIVDFSGRPTGIPSTASNVVIGGDDAHDFIQTGAGADHVTLGNGNDDIVIDNLGGSQVISLGTGTGDSVNVSTTAPGTTVTTAGVDATISFGAGSNETIKALGGGSTLNFTGAGTGEVVHLSNSGGNTVNVGAGGGSITIDGLAATDALFFADAQANATVTQVSRTEVTIAFADTGQNIDLHFANHAAEVAIVGSLHYAA